MKESEYWEKRRRWLIAKHGDQGEAKYMEEVEAGAPKFRLPFDKEGPQTVTTRAPEKEAPKKKKKGKNEPTVVDA